MWKRFQDMSLVFSDALALRETGEVSSAEPLVGSNGLLTLSALEQAREKLTKNHKPHTCHRRYKCLCVLFSTRTHAPRAGAYAYA
jgi:hypothetical protein